MKKASEYYDLYHDKLYSPYNTADDKNKLLKSIFFDFCDEIEELIRIRHPKTDDALAAIIAEQNKKWNALIRIFEKKRGLSYLRPDGFFNFWQEEFKINNNNEPVVERPKEGESYE